MDYIYAAMLLHSTKQEISEKSLTHVLEAAGIKVESTKVKALVASLKEVNIDEAIKSAAIPTAAPAATVAQPAAKEEKKEEEHGKTEEEAAEGLSSLFG